MLSASADGQGVEVVGQYRPGRPGSRAVVAFEARSAQAVAALEVADAALDADPVLGQAAVGASGAGGSAAGGE
jgi:hypothetical protein